MTKPWLRASDKGAEVFLKILPNANRSAAQEITLGVDGQERLKLRVAAIPEKGRANKEVISYLSKNLGLPKTSISIIAGSKDRHKRLSIEGSYECIHKHFETLLKRDAP